MRTLPLLLLFSTALTGCGLFGSSKQVGPPDVVLIVLDTVRADRLGTYGGTRSLTPVMDRFASKSTVFERVYSHSPWTMPSVASIITGLEPTDHGITHWEDHLAPELDTLAEQFQAAGYLTSAMVSHAILQQEYGYHQGFELFQAVSFDHISPHLAITSPEVAEFGIAQVSEPRTRPLFLMLHFFDPHAYYLKHPNKDLGSSDADLYDGEIAYTDKHIGRFLRALSQAGRLENSIIAIVADHGEEFMEHGGLQHTYTLYDELIHIPLMIRVPGFKPDRVRQIVAETQLAPTLLSLAGLPIPASMAAPPLVLGKRGFKEGPDQLIFSETRRYVDKESVIDGDWKLIRDRKQRKHELYNRASDPAEKVNLYDEPSAESEALRLLELLQARSQPRRLAPKVTLRAEQEQALKALGYINE